MRRRMQRCTTIHTNESDATSQQHERGQFHAVRCYHQVVQKVDISCKWGNGPEMCHIDAVQCTVDQKLLLLRIVLERNMVSLGNIFYHKDDF